MGIATYIHRKSIMSNAVFGNDTEISLATLSRILLNLPTGTSISHIKKLGVMDLSMRYEIGLSHPIFKDDTVIEDKSTYRREIGFTKSGEMIQFNYPDSIVLDFKNCIRTGDDLESDTLFDPVMEDITAEVAMELHENEIEFDPEPEV